MKIRVKVKPNARENSIIEIEPGYFEVKVSVPAEKGKANEKVIELVSKRFRIPKSKITITKGQKHKEKLIEIL
jgi:uncharacterized protein (TIGR00251 family)